jgi:hypothetical protein
VGLRVCLLVVLLASLLTCVRMRCGGCMFFLVRLLDYVLGCLLASTNTSTWLSAYAAAVSFVGVCVCVCACCMQQQTRCLSNPRYHSMTVCLLASCFFCPRSCLPVYFAG